VNFHGFQEWSGKQDITKSVGEKSYKASREEPDMKSVSKTKSFFAINPYHSFSQMQIAKHYTNRREMLFRAVLTTTPYTLGDWLYSTNSSVAVVKTSKEANYDLCKLT